MIGTITLTVTPWKNYDELPIDYDPEHTIIRDSSCMEWDEIQLNGDVWQVYWIFSFHLRNFFIFNKKNAVEVKCADIRMKKKMRFYHKINSENYEDFKDLL